MPFSCSKVQGHTMQDETMFWILKTKGVEVAGICEKMEQNVKNVIILSEKELCKLWLHVKAILTEMQEVCTDKIKENSSNRKKYEVALKVIYTIVKLAIKTILMQTSVPRTLFESTVILHSAILPNISNRQVKDKISLFLEKWWKLNLIRKEKIITNALRHLIQTAKTSLRLVKRLYNIKSALSLLKSTEDIQEFLKLTRKKTFISMEEGRTLIVYLFTFGKQYIMGIHNNIKVALENAEPKSIEIYADLYATAWLNACEEDKKIIAENCLKDIIFHCLRAHRDSEGRERLGENLLVFLNYFHKHCNDIVKKMICDQYRPLLWKHLKAPGCFVRCNAADILFLTYPIQQMQSIREKGSSSLLNKQYEAMTDLLKDSNHQVCLITIKGIFKVLATHWSSIPNYVIEEWLNILLFHTKSSNCPEIRVNIFHGLKLILSNSDSVVTLKKVLPKFANSLYDTNPKVKTAFIQLLIHVRDNVKMRVSNIVPLPCILECLEVKSNNCISELIVKLLWPSIFASDDVYNVARRIICMALNNLNAVRKFLLCAKNMIDHDTTLQLIKALMFSIKEHVQFSAIKNSKHEHVQRHKTDSNEESHSFHVSIENSRDNNLNDPLTVQTLFDIVAVLWTINSEEFTKEKCDDEDNLELFVANALPYFYNHFKEAPVRESILFLFSLLPESLISKSVLFSKICIRELYNSDVSDDTILTVVYLLVKRERVDKILKLLTKLLVAPINIHIQSNSRKRMRLKVSVVKEEMLELGMRILKYLLNTEFESILLNNYHQNLIAFWESLSIVKELIEEKLENSNSHNISEKMLESLFRNYISLVPLLDKSNIFDASEHSIKILSWAQSEIMPHVPQIDEIETNRFSITVLKVIFDVSNRTILQFQATPKLCCELVLFYSKCLVQSSGIVFVNEALVTIAALMKFNSVTFRNDESNFLRIVVPSLLKTVMVTLSSHSTDVVMTYTDDLKGLPTLIFKSFLIVEYTLNNSYVLSMVYMTIIFNTAVVCISKELTKILQNKSTKQINILNMRFPYVSEKVLKIILRSEKCQRLCVDSLKKTVPQYTSIDVLSALLIIYRMIKLTTNTYIKKLKKVTLKAKLQSIDASSCTSFDKSIDTSKKQVIYAILNM